MHFLKFPGIARTVARKNYPKISFSPAAAAAVEEDALKNIGFLWPLGIKQNGRSPYENEQG